MTEWSSAELAGHVAGLPLVTDARIHVVTRPCACGVPITADRGSPGAEVARHNASRAHRLWWARVRDEWQGEERS